ncbi:MAG: DNA-binding response regulator [Candidatus Delongbacteria bacterium]|nr:MAG: DNA-binding response regulator [Candidatus Delongbacteria bacterium]
MMKIRTIIIDDEKPARDIIKRYLNSCENIEIIAEADNGFDAYKLINELKPGLIFLDVQMPKINGFELLDILENSPMVIFTTAYDQYALKAFEVNALDYLLKPFDEQRMIDAVNKATEKFKLNQRVSTDKNLSFAEISEEEIHRMVVKKGKVVRILKLEEILYITAEDDYVMVYTLQEQYLKHITMKYLEKHLPQNFMRIHRSTIINLHHLHQVEPYKKDTLVVKMKNNQQLKASQAGSMKLKNYLS